jgi:chorismate synthase
VVGGAIAEQLLANYGVVINAFVQQVGAIKIEKSYESLNFEETFKNKVRCPEPLVAKKMIQHIEEIKKEGDTIGGVIQCVIQGSPVGLGDPVFDKLHADLAKAMLSINAVKGFEFGSGFSAAEMRGSAHNDVFYKAVDRIRTRTNYSGGIQGGISNGEDIYFRIAFKPIATLMQKQQSVNDKGENVELEGKGRHDPCVVPRAVPIVSAMAALVLADHLLRNQSAKL